MRSRASAPYPRESRKASTKSEEWIGAREKEIVGVEEERGREDK